MGVHTWRHPHPETAAWLAYLAATGYQLSPIEQRVIDDARQGPPPTPQPQRRPRDQPHPSPARTPNRSRQPTCASQHDARREHDRTSSPPAEANDQAADYLADIHPDGPRRSPAVAAQQRRRPLSTAATAPPRHLRPNPSADRSR